MTAVYVKYQPTKLCSDEKPSSFSGIILVCGSGHRVLHNGHIGPQAICPSFTDDGSVACGYLSSVTVSTWSQGNSAFGVEMEVGGLAGVK